MNSEMKRIGEMFRKTREEKQLSLKEAENSTSIRSAFLSAIEEGKIEEFISAVYALGFMKQYGNFLGFDVDELMKEYPNAFQMQQEAHNFSYGIGTLEMRRSLGGGVKWIPNLVWSLSAVAIIILGYYFAKFIGLL